MRVFSEMWHQAAVTSIGFFWMALWAFILGYIISSLIQVLVTRSRMQQAMGEDGPRSMLLATFFGFISSSCSFSALSTTRAIFNKGAGLAPSLAFMLASTNLVIELGMVIAIFLGWQFVVGEYVGGVLLILTTWILIRLTRPRRLEAKARKKMDEPEEEPSYNWKKTLTSMAGWERIGQTYVMEWQMVWKDVLIGFTVAGIISAMVPESFFQALFMGSGSEHSANPGFLSVLAQTLVGPLAAFSTFIGSMGNIPLAAVLFSQGVSFAGVMAFIFSDLVVFPVLRINARYYGWKMALYILALMLVAIVVSALILHYALVWLDLLPDATRVTSPDEREFFQINYQLVLNSLFVLASAILVWLWHRAKHDHDHDHDHDHVHDHDHDHGGADISEIVLRTLVVGAVVWLIGGLAVPLVQG